MRISTRSSVAQRGEALLLATAAGALFGVSDVAIKYLTHAHGPLLGLLSPWTLTALVAFVASFYASARSLQIGLAIEVIAITSVAANLAAILGGTKAAALKADRARALLFSRPRLIGLGLGECQLIG